MEFDGYMTRVQWDGQVLRAQGKSMPARKALGGDGTIVVPRQQIADVQFRDAGLLQNGRVTIRTVDGQKHILHFRKKQAAPFRDLVQQLQG